MSNPKNSPQLNVSLLAEIPQDLHSELLAYLEIHKDLDQDRIFTTAIAQFLLRDYSSIGAAMLTNPAAARHFVSESMREMSCKAQAVN